VNKLIISIGYGNEHPAYLRAKNIWSIFREYFKGVDIVFLRSSDELCYGDYKYEDGEYIFRKTVEGENRPLLPVTSLHDAQGFLVERQLKLFERLLVNYEKPFWLLCASITSLVDPRLLQAMLNNLECQRIFAGPPLFTKLNEDLSPDMKAGSVFRMISGSHMLFSSDMVELVVARKNLVGHHMLNDVWTSLILRDIPRIPMLRSDILDVTEFVQPTRDKLRVRVDQDLLNGHFAFRVKSGRWEPEGTLSHRPEDVDTLVLGEIMLHLLSKPADERAAIEGWRRYRESLADHPGGMMLPLA
jgi:hypothetical protein